VCAVRPTHSKVRVADLAGDGQDGLVDRWVSENLVCDEGVRESLSSNQNVQRLIRLDPCDVEVRDRIFSLFIRNPTLIGWRCCSQLVVDLVQQMTALCDHGDSGAHDKHSEQQQYAQDEPFA